MKKLYVLLILIMSSLNTYAAKTHTLEVKVVDAETNEGIENIELFIYSNKFDAVANYTDAEGKATCSWKGRVKYLRIKADDTSGVYRYQIEYLGKEELKEEHMTYTIALTKIPDYSELFAEFRAFDAEIEEQNRLKGDTLLIDFFNDCDDITDAEFPGGIERFQQFINENINYPQEAIEMNEQGKVYLKFIVNSDGTISHVQVERGVSVLLDYESVRLIYSMPKWTPVKCDGEGVRSQARIPIIFTLE